MSERLSCKRPRLRPRWRRMAWTLITMAALAASIQPAQATHINLKISGTMPEYGDVQSYQISPDGRFVVYIANQQTQNTDELFRVPFTGGEPVKLTGAYEGGDVISFSISPDSQRVVYRRQSGVTYYSLYIVPIAGGAPVELYHGGKEPSFNISPDSHWVIYQLGHGSSEVNELYSVPMAGGAPVLLNINPFLDDLISSWQISPDSQRVVFVSCEYCYPDFDYDLHSVPITGGIPVKLDGVPTDYLGVGQYKITPDSQRVIYNAWVEYMSLNLYSVPIAGGQSVKLDLPPGEGDAWGFSISPNSQHVVYRSNRYGKDWQLFSVSATGGTPVKLNGNLVSGRDVWEFQISPNGQQVVYLADQRVDEEFELFRVPLVGGTAQLISQNRKIDKDLNQPRYRISADSQWVVFYAWDEIYPTGVELCSVPMDGSAIHILSGVSVPPGDSQVWDINPNSHSVEFLSDIVNTGDYNLLWAPINRDYSQWWTPINGWLVEGRDVVDFIYHPKGNYVLYKADQKVDEKFELFITFDGIFLPLARRK